MQAQVKEPMNEDIMRQAGFGKEVDLKKAGKCPFCKKDINEKDFKDEISRREFKISGLCQSCQDDTFED